MEETNVLLEVSSESGDQSPEQERDPLPASAGWGITVSAVAAIIVVVVVTCMGASCVPGPLLSTAHGSSHLIQTLTLQGKVPFRQGLQGVGQGHRAHQRLP